MAAEIPDPEEWTPPEEDEHLVRKAENRCVYPLVN
jgi:hypothetical protein